MMEELQLMAFQMIAYIGEAKSFFMQAIQEAENGNVDVEEIISKGNESLVKAHKSHFSLIQKEANGEKIEFSLILMHAEDQLMTVELLKEISIKMINIYKKMNG